MKIYKSKIEIKKLIFYISSINNDFSFKYEINKIKIINGYDKILIEEKFDKGG